MKPPASSVLAKAGCAPAGGSARRAGTGHRPQEGAIFAADPVVVHLRRQRLTSSPASNKSGPVMGIEPPCRRHSVRRQLRPWSTGEEGSVGRFIGFDNAQCSRVTPGCMGISMTANERRALHPRSASPDVTYPCSRPVRSAQIGLIWCVWRPGRTCWSSKTRGVMLCPETPQKPPGGAGVRSACAKPSTGLRESRRPRQEGASRLV